MSQPPNLRVCGLLACALALSPAAADIRLPAIIASGMVLQQDSTVPIWGWAEPGETIRVSPSWPCLTIEVTADQSGFWRAFLPTPTNAASPGPQTLAISGKKSVTLSDILLGEVWFCSGQSNMEMFVGNPTPDVFGGVDHWQEEVKSAAIPDLRLFDVANAVAASPLTDCRGRWEASTPERAALFSATAFFFGRELRSRLGVPVGLITSDWGGTPIQAWTSLGAIKSQGGLDHWLPILEQLSARGPDLDRQYAQALDGWRAGVDAKDAGIKGGWMTPEFDDSAWPTMDQPAPWSGDLANFDGAVWCRRAFDLPAVTGDATLHLGPIDDHDQTWVNGVKVGEHLEDGVYAMPREYRVPAGVLRAGRNVIAIRVIDTMVVGGLCGRPEDVCLRIDSTAIPLAGPWKYHIGPALADLPPRPPHLAPGPGIPTNLFNAMVAPVIPFGIRGVIWYQGEANRDEAFAYRTMFPAMIADWRYLWGRGEFPFYFVQIAPFDYGPDAGQTGELREAQAMALKLPHTGMAVTMDIGDPADIHPRNKQEVGRRLALCALSGAYGQKIESSGPVYDSMAVESGRVRLRFDHATGLAPADQPLTCFTIAGRDKRFVPAQAKVDGTTILVWSDQVPAPVAVRFAWGDADQPNLHNGAGLPAGPFRTDQWPGVTEPMP